MVMEACQLPNLERVTVFCPGARYPKVVLEWLAKLNETPNVLSMKLSFKEVNTKKGEVETSFQVMVEATELKALEALECPWRYFCGLKRALCVHWIQEDGDEANQKPMETEEKTGEEEVGPVSQTTQT